MHQIVSQLGLRPRLTRGAYSAPAAPLAVWGATSIGGAEGMEGGSSSFALGKKRKVIGHSCWCLMHLANY